MVPASQLTVLISDPPPPPKKKHVASVNNVYRTHIVVFCMYNYSLHPQCPCSVQSLVE